MYIKRLTACVLFLCVLAPFLPLQAEYRGMETFKEAYRMEKTEPAAAAALYRQAISEGLDRKVYNAARWRLYYIYKQLDEFESAILLLSTFGEGSQIANVRSSLISQIAYFYSISYEAADQYAMGLLLSRTDPDKAFQYFQGSLHLSKKNYRLRNDILDILFRNGRSDDAGNLFSSVSESRADEMIARADIFINQKNYTEARNILYEISAESYSLSDKQKYKILYLLGKIEKGKGNEHTAVVYFRQAARYESESKGEYPAALSAYSLYRQGNAESAWGLIKSYPLSKDPNVELLQLILAAEMENDANAVKKLKTKEEALKNQNTFLANRGIEILKQHYDEKGNLKKYR